MQVVWEADTAAFANRKRAARACAACQKRKKRCHHTFSKQPTDRLSETEGIEKVLPNLTHREPIRFIGDLNPESILSDLSSKQKDAAPRPTNPRIGLWIEEPRIPQDPQKQDDASLVQTEPDDKVPVNVEKYAKVEGGRRILTGHQRNYLQAVGAFRVLPKDTQDVLVSTYFTYVDDVMPIIDCRKTLSEYKNGHASIFLIQAICLIACKMEGVASCLRLYENGPSIDPIPFARSLHTGLDAAMKADLEPNRLTRIQILTLMHLHNDGPAGIEESSSHLSQAIHDAWTAGLHIQTPGRTPDDSSSMLWWTLWSLDRLNACVGGRPVMIADRDIDIERPSMAARPVIQTINIWIRLGDLLDRVIDYYRPTAKESDTGWEEAFPKFDDILAGIKVEMLHDSARNILEILYNIIAILSCRTGGPSASSYARRITASDRIQQLLSGQRLKEIPPFPLVPYACSLSLTVAYRDVRDQHKDPERAKRDLATRCEMLETLSKSWWTADAMAKLGRKALKSIQQPGFRKQSVLNLSNAMDGEIVPCKYGPFDARPKQKRKAPSNDTEDSIDIDEAQIDPASANALQLLSDAAAKHAKSNSSTPTLGSTNKPTKPSRLRGIPSSISHDGSLLSMNRFNYQQYNYLNFQNPNYQNNILTQSTIPSAVAHSHALPQGLLSNTAVNASARIPTPAQLSNTDNENNNLPPSMSYFPTSTSSSTATNTPGGTMGTIPIDPSVYDQYSHQFENLDNLFDGFFDLSLPTMFMDPLFEGAAYFNTYAVEDETSMDTNMMMGLDPSAGDMSQMGMTPNLGMNMAMSGAMGGNMGMNLAMGLTSPVDLSMPITSSDSFPGMASMQPIAVKNNMSSIRSNSNSTSMSHSGLSAFSTPLPRTPPLANTGSGTMSSLNMSSNWPTSSMNSTSLPKFTKNPTRAAPFPSSHSKKSSTGSSPENNRVFNLNSGSRSDPNSAANSVVGTKTARFPGSQPQSTSNSNANSRSASTNRPGHSRNSGGSTSASKYPELS